MGGIVDDLRGANAIVTGASRGIGVHIARALARERVNVSLAARSETELEAVRAEIESLGVKAIATRCDVSKPDDRALLLSRTEAELGPVDILVNAAGIAAGGVLDDPAYVEAWHAALAVNLTGTLHMVRACLDDLVSRGEGRIVHVGGRVATADGSVIDGEGRLVATATATCMVFRGGAR